MNDEICERFYQSIQTALARLRKLEGKVSLSALREVLIALDDQMWADLERLQEEEGL